MLRHILAVSLLSIGGLAFALSVGSAENETRERAQEPALCDVEHPLRARAVALDPLRHGGTLRVQVTVTPQVATDNASVQLVSAGGTRHESREAIALGSLKAGQEASGEFTFTVPAQGHRFLLVFRLRGDGPSGVLARDVTFNVLPDGPADPGVVRVTPDGRGLREYSARRLGS